MNSKYCLEAYNVHIVKAHIDDCRWGDVAIGNGLLEDSLVVGVSDNTGGMVELGDGGMEIRVGAFLPFDQSPMSIKNVTFANFTRWKSSAAVGWNGHFWLNMPASQSQGVHLVNSRAIYYPSIDPNKSEATVATFYDLDGSLTGTGKATAVVYNNPLQVDGNCSAHPEANAMYCPGNYHYARNVLELSNPLPLVRNDGATSNMGSINQAIGTTFLTNTSYSIHLNNPAPANFRMFLSKMEPDNWVRFSLNTGYGKPFVYPDADNRSHPLTEAQSLADLDASQGNMFYFDASTNTVYFKFIPTITAITFCQHEKCAG